jgi:hypothetical protein
MGKSGLIACAAKGERDPATLKIAALLAVVECSHYSHDISPERRAVEQIEREVLPLEDLQARFEKLLTDAEDCALIGKLAPT